MGNHASICRIWEGTQAWLSYQPRRLIFFVHGFGGDNAKTWLNFPALMLDDPRHARDDLIFLGYESRRQAAKASGGLLFQRSNEFLSHPDRFKDSIGRPRSRDFSYEKIVLVGHSLGGAVIRHMILEALARECQWLDQTALIFFAPATAGARVERLVSLAVGVNPGTFLPFLHLAFRLKWPVIDDLTIGSPFLMEISQRTQRAIQDGHRTAQSRETFFGTRENIIDLASADLPFDRPYTYLEHYSHVDVCKPVNKRDEPYVRFAELLENI